MLISNKLIILDSAFYFVLYIDVPGHYKSGIVKVFRIFVYPFTFFSKQRIMMYLVTLYNQSINQSIDQSVF